MEQNVTPSPGALGDLDRAAPVHKSRNEVTDVGRRVGQQVDLDRAAPVHKSPTSDPEGLPSNLHAGKSPLIKYKFWIVAFLVAAKAILSWVLVHGMADAWEHRGHSLSSALLRPF